MNTIELKELIRMVFIYNALESGWTVRKALKPVNTFEFIRDGGVHKKSECVVPNKHYFSRRCISEPLTFK